MTFQAIIAQVEHSLNLPPKQSGNIFGLYYVHKAMIKRGETSIVEMTLWVMVNGGRIIEGDGPCRSTIAFDDPDDAFAFKLRWC